VPEDGDVQRARWNAELLRKGAWHKAVQDLATKATTTKDVVAVPTAVRPPVTGKWPSKQAARMPREVPVPL